MLASSAVPLIMVMSCAVSFLNAALSGANTVMFFAALRVPASPALRISAARVVISGLWLAAVTTGSVIMPCMLPIPAAGIMPQSVPTVPAVAAGSVLDAEGWADLAGEAAGAAAEVPELPQAAAVSASAPTVAAMASTPVLLVLFLFGVGM